MLSPFALQKTRRGRILRSNTTNCSKAYGEEETIESTDGGKHGEKIGGGKSQEWLVPAQWLASVNNLQEPAIQVAFNLETLNVNDQLVTEIKSSTLLQQPVNSSQPPPASYQRFARIYRLLM